MLCIVHSRGVGHGDVRISCTCACCLHSRGVGHGDVRISCTCACCVHSRGVGPGDVRISCTCACCVQSRGVGPGGVTMSYTCVCCLHSHSVEKTVWQSVARVLVCTATWQCDSQLYVCLLPTQPQCGEDGVAVSCTCACPHSHMAV